jgi:hypothetical protein
VVTEGLQFNAPRSAWARSYTHELKAIAFEVGNEFITSHEPVAVIVASECTDQNSAWNVLGAGSPASGATIPLYATSRVLRRLVIEQVQRDSGSVLR